ncbi:hypothetical protein TWF281_010216 [Arthrobotrys megalospora]
MASTSWQQMQLLKVVAEQMQDDTSFKKTPLYHYSDPDVTLVIGENEVKVHEYVLASQSEFFKAALRCGLKESQEKRITLPEIQPDNVFVVLNWLYRAPLRSHFKKDIRETFSDESTEKLTKIMEAFDFLQIKGAGRDYCKFVEERLQQLAPNTWEFRDEQTGNIVTILNEVYRAEGSITQEAMDRLVEHMVYRSRLPRSSPTVLGTFIEAAANLLEPEGRCFRDISLALGRSLRARIAPH